MQPPGPDPADDASTPPKGRPWPLVVALGVVAIEAVLLGVLGVAELVALDGSRLVMGLSTAAFFLGYGALLALCARAVWRGEAWARSIIVMGQLIQLGTAWSNRDANPTLAGVAALAALVVLAGIFHPASLRTLTDD